MSPDTELTLFDVLPEAGPAAPDAEEEISLSGGRAATVQQADAIRRRSSSLLLTATAGSGKTAVLVERFVRAVLEDDVAPSRILAITFTEKAAGELRERVRERFVECGAREAARETEAAFVSTIHGFCARLLRTHALAAGLDPGFGVLDEAQAAALRDEAFDRALERFVERGAGAVDVVAAYGADRLSGMTRDAYETLRSRGARDPALPAPAPRSLDGARASLERARDALADELRESAEDAPADVAEALERCAELLAAATVPTPGDVGVAGLTKSAAGRSPATGAYAAAVEEFRRACADHHGAAVGRLLAELVSDYGEIYRGLKRARSAVDFDDLELEAGRLVAEDAAVRDEWSQRFELVMVDEFQDTNPRQLALLEALERDNLFCVGDEMQSIYAFRDADVALFRARRERLDEQGAAISLTESFRARPEVVEAVNVAFSTRPANCFVALEPARRDPPAEGGPRVELLLTDQKGWEETEEGTTDLGPAAAAARMWRRAEAKLLAQRVTELVEDGTSVGDIAVLLRATTDLSVYERALEERGLPTVSAGGGGFWARLEITDLVAYLRLVANPLDEHALYSVLASPLVGASSDALALVGTTARELARGAWWTLEEAFGGDGSAALATRMDPADRAVVDAFLAWMREERPRAPRLPLATVVARMLERSGYEERLRAAPGGARRIRNVHKLLHLAGAYEDEQGRDLRGFLDFAVARSRMPGSEVEAPLPEGEETAIRVMTIHAAKGLEFDVVCVADLGRAPSLSTPDVLIDGDRLGLRVVSLDGRQSVPALAYDELREARLDADAAEEDRVMFVALTRARERLILSGAVDLERWPGPGRTAPPISWLAPALAPGLAERLQVGELDFEAEAQAGEHRTVVRCVLHSPTRGRPLFVAPEEPQPVPVSSPPAPATAAASPETVAVAGTAAHDEAGAIVSYSSLAAYARCGYRFYLEREMGLPAADATNRDSRGDGVDARDRGVLVHELLEGLDFASAAPPAPEQVREAGRRRGIALSTAEAAEIAGLVAAFAGSAVCARLARATDCSREREFTFTLEPTTLVTGVVDVLAWEADGAALVVDYKSDRVGDADLAGLVQDLYATQRHLYALAALRAGASAVEVVYCFLERVDEPVAARFSAAEASTLETGLRDVAGGLLRGEFPVTDNPHRDLCLTCPGRRTLCSWPEAMTMMSRGT